MQRSTLDILDPHMLGATVQNSVARTLGARDMCIPDVPFNEAQRLQLGLTRAKEARHIQLPLMYYRNSVILIETIISNTNLSANRIILSCL